MDWRKRTHRKKLALGAIWSLRGALGRMIEHSDEVLNAVLSMARRHDLVFAQKLVDLEQRPLGGVDTYRIHKMMAARVTTAR
jgi:hypothetical protein